MTDKTASDMIRTSGGAEGPFKIGTDESGKGDYFGPLVVCAVRADTTREEIFRSWGVQDSKKISDGRAAELTAKIKAIAVVKTVVIGPRRYDELRTQMKNLNRLLAWAHARAIEDILAEHEAVEVVADQFGDERLIRGALQKRGRAIALHQRHRAESDPTVAAASVCARAEFLRRLRLLEREAGMPLHKGAGAPVDRAAAAIIRQGGEDALRPLVKWHFKNTAKARALAGSVV